MIPPLIIAGIAGASALGLFKLRKSSRSQNSIYNWTEAVGYHDEITPNACLDDGMPLLIKAIKLGRVDIVKKLFEMNINPDIFCPKRKPALFYALESKHATKLLPLFIKHKANINIMDSNGSTGLFIAQNDKIISMLCEAGCVVNAQTPEGKTALHTCKSYFISMQLINHGANLNIQDKEGKTPIFYLNDPELIRLFLTCGANPNIQDNEGKTALFYASTKTQLLVDNDNLSIYTPAASSIVSVLLEFGADPNIQDNEGKTPIFYFNYPELIRLYLTHGANPNIQDNEGKTPIFYLNDPELIHLYLTHGANPNIQDNEGKTALFHTSTKTKLLFDNGKQPLYTSVASGIVSRLLKFGADPNIQDKEGKTPIFYFNNPELIRLCLTHGANPNIQDNEGKTPLCYINSKATASLLIDFDAVATHASLPPKVQDICNQILTEQLYDSLQRENFVSIENALKKGADPSAICNGSCMLKLAKTKEVLELLCNYGADPNKHCGIHTPLTQWIFKNDPTCCRILVEHGAKIEAHHLNDAIKTNHDQCCEVLLKAGYHVTNDNWQTALCHGFYKIIELLEEYSEFKLTLDEAPTLELKIRIAEKSNQHIDIQSIFAQKYPDYLELDTNLVTAVSQNDTAAVKILLEKGANPDCKIDDKTILRFAIDNNQTEIAELLYMRSKNKHPF